MRVLPQRIGAAALDVDEAPRRRPVDDLRPPGDRDAEEPQPVAERRALADPVGRLDDPEVQPAGRDRLEVLRLGEEPKRLLRRATDELISDEPAFAQRIPPRSWWARKNSCEPAVAIAADAEISSASVAAETICAKR